MSAPLSTLTGWWNSVQVGDFNGDGDWTWWRATGVATPNGRNIGITPPRIDFGEAREDSYLAVESYFDRSLGKWVPRVTRDAILQVAPYYFSRFPTHQSYAQSGIDAIFNDPAHPLEHREVTTFESMVFLNEGGSFRAVSLPKEAQFAPVFGLAIGDLDGDGHEDIFAAQNFFAVDPELSRQDAGGGLCIMGDGQGHFHVLEAIESGVRLLGEGRGAALGDFDSDGRVDVAVRQNSGTTVLLHNETGKAGLAVRVHGPPGNPTGVGVQLRLEFADGVPGAVRELHAGGGFWSQDSAIQVLGLLGEPSYLLLHWPGGRRQRLQIPRGARGIEVSQGGVVVEVAVP